MFYFDTPNLNVLISNFNIVTVNSHVIFELWLRTKFFKC